MMTDFEIRARTLVAEARNSKTHFHPSRRAILMVFDSYPERAWTVDRLEAVAGAIVDFDQTQVQRELLYLVQQKVLRSRLVGGKRHYELNVAL
jgi:hypothetical protein